VVEAGMRSGARNTAKWARRLGRPALAVPGPITAAASVGCHRMIRDREAILVTRVDEIHDEVGPLRLSLPTGTEVGPDLAGDQATVFAELPVAGSRLPKQIAGESGLTIHAVRAALVALEVAGLVGSDSSGWFRTVRKGA